MSALAGRCRLLTGARARQALSCSLVLGLVSALPCLASPSLEIRALEQREGHLAVTYLLTGLFDAEIQAALESGLPATLAFRWQLFHDRPGRRNEREAMGLALLRIYYDVLEDRYTIFGSDGRSIASCKAAAELEAALRETGELRLPLGRRLQADRIYYLELEARLEPLDPDEIRDLEGWLRGGGDEDPLSGVSRYAEGALKRLAGLGSRQAKARSEGFHGGS